MVLTPVIVIRAAGGAAEFLSWAVFAAVIVSGVTTILQAVRVGRIGAGYVLLMGTSGAFISVCIAAIAEGGPGMLATLVVISSLFQFALASRLSLFRRIFTPTVAGTVIMLISRRGHADHLQDAGRRAGGHTGGGGAPVRARRRRRHRRDRP